MLDIYLGNVLAEVELVRTEDGVEERPRRVLVVEPANIVGDILRIKNKDKVSVFVLGPKHVRQKVDPHVQKLVAARRARLDLRRHVVLPDGVRPGRVGGFHVEGEAAHGFVPKLNPLGVRQEQLEAPRRAALHGRRPREAHQALHLGDGALQPRHVGDGAPVHCLWTAALPAGG